MSEVRFRPVADHALLAEFSETVSERAHQAVLSLDRRLRAAPFPGFLEAVPAYVSLLVDFEPLVTDHAAVEASLRGLLMGENLAASAGTLREVAVCYDEEFGRDLSEVARLTGLSIEGVINAHLSGVYTVAMYGFAPGYAYLAGTPPPIRLPRKPVALRGVEAGSVLIAGPQCLVSTLTMPTGWWIVGRSPSSLLTDDPVRPFLFDVGDRVAFRRVARAELEAAFASP